MPIKMGPVLAFNGIDNGVWKLSAVIVTDEDVAPPLTWSDPQALTAQGEMLWQVGRRKAFRYRFQSRLAGTPTSLTYAIDGQCYEVAIPAAGQSPCMAYASCNGFSSPKAIKSLANKNAMWETLAARHRQEPYHLLLLGGDQVYADSLWETTAAIGDWYRLDFADGNARRFTRRMNAEAEKFYMDLYTSRWVQPAVAAMLARVPMVAMWDDHDIFDGWGSYPAERQNCAVFQGIGRHARRAFAVFQQHLRDDDPPRACALGPQFGFSCAHVVGRTGILAIDMRSERSEAQVLSIAHWNAIYAWLDSLAKGSLDHLLIMSSIPVVYPGFDTLEQLLSVFPGHQEIEDDLRDHWNSKPHKGERLRMINRLLDFVAAKEIAPTILSGDVHLAALGLIESTPARTGAPIIINQLISSGIVHPAPGAAIVFMLQHLFDSKDDIEPGMIRARMTEFPGNTARYINRRNFLSLEPDDKHRIWANWVVEQEPHPYTKVLLPWR